MEKKTCSKSLTRIHIGTGRKSQCVRLSSHFLSASTTAPALCASASCCAAARRLARRAAARARRPWFIKVGWVQSAVNTTSDVFSGSLIQMIQESLELFRWSWDVMGV